MRTSYVALALVALLSCAHAVEVENTRKNVITKVTETLKNLKSTQFGEHILKTVELQLQAGGNTDNVLNLLAGIRADLESQAELETNDYNRDSTALENQINDLIAEAQSALNEVAEATTRVGELWSQISDLNDEVPRLETEVVRIRGQKQKLERLRQEDIEDYVRRVAEQRQVVEVLSQIISSLSQIALNGGASLIEKKEIMQKLTSTKYTEPLLALVDLSSTFDPAFLRNVIVRLEHIRDAITESIEQDQEDEEEAKLNYDNIHGQLEDIQSTFVNDWAAAKRELQRLNNELTVEENRRDTNQEVHDAAEAAQANAEQELQSLTDEHNARQSHFEQELDLIAQALNIVTANAASLRNYD
jgi:chromosome segregation ATPase